MSREQIASSFQLWRLNQLGQITWAKEEAKGDDRILAREASEALDALAAAGRFTPRKRPEEPKEEGD